MNKYDFGYEMHKGSTIEWAYHHIKPNSLLLEVGPSNGNLISHLTREKGCTADIVEISKESGEEAAQFARVACIGEVEGNLERNEWLQKLSQYKYDYIVILDVLEHIRNPEEVLTNLKQLLHDDGTIILSVPNLAHNSVLLNLLENKFTYTDVGLLDNTHVHFFTYESLKQLLNKVGLITETEEVIQKQVGENEILAYYGHLPSNIESFLKTRPLGTAYQFLFQVKKGDLQPPTELCYEEDKNYSVLVFQDNIVIYSAAVCPINQVFCNVCLANPASTLRLDPLDKNCILRDFEILGYDCDDKVVEISCLKYTGNPLNGMMVFYDDDPQIFVEWATAVTRVEFRYSFVIFDNDALRIIQAQKDYVRELERFKIDATDLRAQLEGDNQQLISQISGLQAQCSENADIIAGLEQKSKELAVGNSHLHEKLAAANQREQQLLQAIADEKEIEKQMQVTIHAEQENSVQLLNSLQTAQCNAAQLQNLLQEERSESMRKQNQIDDLRQLTTNHKFKSIWKLLTGKLV